MRRLFRFLIQLVLVMVVFIAVTVGLVIFDGLRDVGDSADVALVVGHGNYSGGSNPPLEKAAKLFTDGKCDKIILSAPKDEAAGDELTAMTKFTEEHGVPSAAIILDSGAKDTAEMAHDVATVLKSRKLDSVLIIDDYYRLSRLKLALLHAGVTQIAKIHVGDASFNDAGAIAWETVSLYRYLYHTFLVPAAEEIKSEATKDADKVKAEAEKTKDTVDKKLDSLPK